MKAIATTYSQRNCTHKTKMARSCVINLLDNAENMFRLNGKWAQNTRTLPASLSYFMLTE